MTFLALVLNADSQHVFIWDVNKTHFFDKPFAIFHFYAPLDFLRTALIFFSAVSPLQLARVQFIRKCVLNKLRSDMIQTIFFKDFKD